MKLFSKIKRGWQNYLSSGIALSEGQDMRHVWAVNAFTLVGFFTFLFFGLVNIVSGEITTGIVELLSATIAAFNVAALRVTHRAVLATSVILAIMFASLLFLLMEGGIANTGMLWFATFPALAFFMKGKRDGTLWTAMLLVATVALALLQETGALTLAFSFVAVRQLVASTMVISLLIYLYADMNERNERIIIGNEHALMAANSRLASEVAERRRDEEHLQRTVQELGAKNALLAESQAATTKALDDAEREREKFEFQVWETRKFEQAVVSSSDGVIIATPEGIIIYVNPAWEKLSGYSFNDVEGKKLGDLKSGLTNPAIYDLLWATITKGQPFNTEEIINRRKDGTTYEASLAISPVLEGDKIVFFVGLEQDISRRKAVERAKSEFVSLASHQLRTPLAAIRWYAEMLLDGDVGRLTKGQRSYLEEISHANKRMVALVGDLLNISRLELGTLAVEPEPTSVATLVKEVVKELQPQILERHHVVALALDTKLPTIMADPKVLSIVVQNIITNAIKYTPPKGKISITLAREDHAVRLDITDNGIGIPRHAQDKIFQKFFRAENAAAVSTDGTGLGLYFAKSVIEQSRGRLWFVSEENHGTTFSLTLPLSGMIKTTGTKKAS